MAAEQGGLQAEVGITLNRLTQQLAQAEARMVKTAKKMEGDFRGANRAVSRSFEQVDTATRGLTGSGGLRMVSMQLSQVGQQGAITGDYLRALSIQMPDLLLAFGAWGALIGTAAAALGPFISNMLSADDATKKLVDSLVGGQVSLDSVRGSISQLRDLQEQYTAAIQASAGASSATAAAVAANSEREFNARKQVLAVERELLRIRGEEQRANLRNLQDQVQAAAESQIRSNSSGMNGGNPLDPSLRPYVYGGPRTSEEVLGSTFLKEQAPVTLAIRKLRAEIELTELAAEEAAQALNGEFLDVGGAAGGTATGGGGGGRGSGGRGGAGAAATPAAEKVREVGEQLKLVAIDADRASGMFATTFSSIITGAQGAEDALGQLARRIADMAIQASLNGLFDQMGIFDWLGGGKHARGNAISGGRVVPFARGGVVNGPSVFPMAKGMGLMGEAGPEAILPLRRGSGGKLGVDARSAAPVINMPVNIVNQAPGVEVTTQRQDGRLDIMVRRAVSDTIRGGGADGAMNGRFGLTPRARGA